MKYLLAFLLPPLAVLMCGKPILALLNIVLTALGWIPGILHALFIVNNFNADRRNKNLIEAIVKSKT